jgi:hypothetical protein
MSAPRGDQTGACRSDWFASGCGDPATTTDIDGRPSCQWCADALAWFAEHYPVALTFVTAPTTDTAPDPQVGP